MRRWWALLFNYWLCCETDMGTHYDCEWDYVETDCDAPPWYMELIASTGTEQDPLWKAKDTVNWFAGRTLFDDGVVTLSAS